MTRILAIETSCDETAASVTINGTDLVTNIIASQTDLHAQYGGIFPEVASRKHIEVIYPVIEKAMSDAHIGWSDLDAIAVTQGPGLAGSLLVGVNAAKGIALSRNLPLIPINHLEGHIYSLWLTGNADQIKFPILNLLVSGGHTELILMTDHLTYEHLGGTLDDAAGEAFDKVGRLLNLPYPGGPHIDRAAKDGNPTAYAFPRAVMDDGYNFSFSGLKTAVLRETKHFNPDHLPVNDLSASFQAAVIDALVTKTARAVAETNCSAVHLSGGVSANSGLRKALDERISIPVRYPPLSLCTDNAAMIASAAHFRLLTGEFDDSLDFDVHASLQLV